MKTNNIVFALETAAANIGDSAPGVAQLLDEAASHAASVSTLIEAAIELAEQASDKPGSENVTSHIKAIALVLQAAREVVKN